MTLRLLRNGMQQQQLCFGPATALALPLPLPPTSHSHLVTFGRRMFTYDDTFLSAKISHFSYFIHCCFPYAKVATHRNGGIQRRSHRWVCNNHAHEFKHTNILYAFIYSMKHTLHNHVWTIIMHTSASFFNNVECFPAGYSLS